MTQVHFNHDLGAIVIGNKALVLYTEADGPLEDIKVSPHGSATFSGENDEVNVAVKQLTFEDD